MTPLPTRHGIAGAWLALCLGLPTSSLHAQPDFGDNTSQWANDGECDDPRFEGEGAADTLLDGDRGHDATDCRKLFNNGRIALRKATAATNDAIDFGDDENEWARDGECDDPRFAGEGSAATLLEADAYHDATDCRTLFGARPHRAARQRRSTADLNRGRLEKGDDTLKLGRVFATPTHSPAARASAPSSICAPATSTPTCSYARRAASSSTTTTSKATPAARCCRSI